MNDPSASTLARLRLIRGHALRISRATHRLETLQGMAPRRGDIGRIVASFETMQAQIVLLQRDERQAERAPKQRPKKGATLES